MQPSGPAEVAKPATSDQKPISPDTAKTSGEPAADKGVKTSVTDRPPDLELSGITGRLYEVPVPAGNYSGLEVTDKHLLWLSRDQGFGAKTQINQLEITAKEPKPKTLVEDVRSSAVGRPEKAIGS